MNYIVYITINTYNSKFYIGVHKTNPETFDGYIGCGIYRESQASKDIPFHKAVKKYGYNAFKRTIIQIFPDTDEGRTQAYQLEQEIVNSTLLKSKNCYNVSVGGFGSINMESKKSVYMFDLNGNYLRKFSCVKEAAMFINNTDLYGTLKAIRNNCLGTSNSSYGYFWSYQKKFTYKQNNKCKKIAQYTLKGEFIRTFDSISQAQQLLEINTIHQAINKKCSSGGYQWRYYTGDNSNISTLITTANKNKTLPINMYNSNMKLIKKFKSIYDCIIEYPELKASQINRVLSHVIKSHKGYIFKYQDEDIVKQLLKDN